MVKIRLTKTGKKHHLSYRIVVVDSRKKRDGHYVEMLGFYNPTVNPPIIKINQERLKFWQSVGAQINPAVAKLISRR
jgi:small subunit ribosomal protein S16